MEPLYKDAGRAVEDRVDDLLDRMTLDEKVAQVGCVWLDSLVRQDRLDQGAAAALLRHGIGEIARIGSSTGLGPDATASLTNDLQRMVVEGTRLGIPLIVHEESTGGYCARGATVFPQGLGLAASWDPGLVEEVASAIRRQLLAVGARHTLAPVLDVARDPRWGRVEETYGENPVLCGALGVAYVRGMQTEDLRGGVAATGKHFLAYAMSEGGRNHGPAQVGPREMREALAEPFAATIRDAGLASVMNSYGSVDGLPAAGSRAVLTGLLREELGFDGPVVADYSSVGLLVSHHRTAATKAEAAVQAITAGLDMELPALDCFAEIPAEVAAGRLPAGVLDQAVRRVLALKFRLGLFEQPYVAAARASEVFDTPADRALARRAAAESVVLLSNDGVLPLSAGLRSIAVLGPCADEWRLLQGDYHYPAHVELTAQIRARSATPLSRSPREGGDSFEPGPYYTPHVTPLRALVEVYGSARVRYERGCEVTGGDRSGIPAAVEAARESEVALVLAGGRSGITLDATVGEARDAVDLGLTGHQQELVEEVIATGTPTVVVVVSGRVHTLGSVARGSAALAVVFPPGEEGGHGIVDVLTGAAPASGRLPVSIPRHVGQVPVYADHRAGGGTAAFYGQYTDCDTTPLFPFGHGLGYTSFAFEDLRVAATTTGEPVEAALVVKNTGSRPGTEVVQLYYRDEVASVARPDRELAGFARVELAEGASARIRFEVHPSRLAFYDESMRFVCEPGTFTFSVCSSATSVAQQATVTLAGPVVEYRQREVVATKVTVG